MVTTANLPRPKAKAKAKAKARKPRSASQRKPVLQRAPSQAIARVPSLPERIETLLMQGDLTGLSVQERLQFYKALCRTLGLNPLTRPFEYIVFTDRDQDEDADPNAKPKGKMILYARADCAAQLRKIHKVGIAKDMRRRRDGEFYIVEADAFIHEKAGIRTDTSTGIVWLKKVKFKGGQRSVYDLEGRDLANAMMKAETKAKRRVTFSICGLHILDESEIEDLTQLTFDVTEGGRIIEVLPPAGAKEPDCGYCGKMDAPQGCAEKLCPIRSDPAWFEKNQAQRELVISKLKEFSKQQASRTGNPTTPSSARTAGAANPEATSMGAAPAVLSLTYELTASGTYFIDGPDGLKSANKDLLGPLWNGAVRAIVATPERLGKLISQFERRKVPFKEATVG